MPPPDDSALPRQPLRVLIVEDNPADAELMLHALRRSGFEPEATRVHAEAEYAAGLDTTPDLILSDYALPQFGGARALQLLQERGLGVPFILVSGQIGEEAAVAMMKRGAVDYVPKDRLDRLGEIVLRAIHGERKIAYFSMEIALHDAVPTYSGGLGVLAGDTVRAAADLDVPMVAISLLHRAGYFSQRLDANGMQCEQPIAWSPQAYLTEMPGRARIGLEGRTVFLRAWRYQVQGVGGYAIPVYLLDTDVPENGEWDRRLTDSLYGGDDHYRLSQEIVLGVGGVRMLRALGYDRVDRFHMNEGHSSLLTIELLQEEARRAGRSWIELEDLAAVRSRCIFTTHTPVPAGHDQFPIELMHRVLGHRQDLLDMRDTYCAELVSRVLKHPEHFPDVGDMLNSGGVLNMTYLALNLSRYVNGVAKKHGEVSRLMFAGYEVDAITNGVHAATWTSDLMQRLYDRHIPGWRRDNAMLRGVLNIPTQEIWDAHEQAKLRLVDLVRRRTGMEMSSADLTLGYARRMTPYKRPDFLLTDLARLRRISTQAGRIQVIFAGKAHPHDQAGKELIQRVFQAQQALRSDVKIAFLENYDIELAKVITAGVDVWLNTPQPPLEASGTSGMKAALNGVPSLSVLDGWWIEGHIEGVTGWSFGDLPSGADRDADRARDAESLYDKLELIVVPKFYRRRDEFLQVMTHAMAVNGSFFNTQRMVQQYVLRAYFGSHQPEASARE